MYREETWLSWNWGSLGFLYAWEGSWSWHVHISMHTYAHTWNHVPSLWFEFTTCRRTHMQMWRLGSDTHVQTIHEHSPTWHMYISSSPALTRMHRDSLGKSNSVQLNLIQPSSVQQMLIKHLLYAMDYLALRILNFFLRWNLRSQFRGGGSLANKCSKWMCWGLWQMYSITHTLTHTHTLVAIGTCSLIHVHTHNLCTHTDTHTPVKAFTQTPPTQVGVHTYDGNMWGTA